MTPVWTITYLGTEQSAAAWGLTAQPKIKTRDRSPTQISFRMAGAAPEGSIPFPFKAQVIIRSNRTLSGGQWSVVSGPSFVFTGYQTTQPADVDGKSQGITLVFKDAIWLLQNTTFQQLWYKFSSPGSPFYSSRLILFMDINAYAANQYYSVQWQILQMLSYASAQCGINIAAGTIDYYGLVDGSQSYVYVVGSGTPAGWFMNYYHCRALSCWDVLLKCLEPIPDAKVWIDGSQNPPVLNIRTRANLSALPSPLSGASPGPITLPYKGVDAAGRLHHSSHGFQPRYDLVPAQVVLQYQTNNTINGQSVPQWQNDVYPATVGGNADGQMPFAMVCPIDLTGYATTLQTGTLDCEPLMVTAAQTGQTSGSAADHAAKRAWWGSKRGGEQHKLINENGTQNYALRFADQNGNLQAIGDATVVDESGAAINLATYPNRICKGTVHKWMTTSGGAPIVAIRAKITVVVAFAEYDVTGSTPAETDTNGNLKRLVKTEKFTVGVTLTNAASGLNNYISSNLTEAAELPVIGLAQSIYASRATLDYDGSHEIIDPGIKNGSGETQPLQQLIGPWNLLNFSGGATAWATANMTISGTEIDLLNNHIRIEVGPSKHLQPQDWNSMLQFFRFRRTLMDPAVRGTGTSAGNNEADMPQNTPDANTVPGLALDQQHGLVSADAANSGVNNVVQVDATTGQITVAQQPAAGGSNLTSGTINPLYLGSGNPAAGLT